MWCRMAPAQRNESRRRAGVEKSTVPELFERDIILTSSSGRSAPALAEHALLFMLALTYDLPMLGRAQAQHRWAADRAYCLAHWRCGCSVPLSSKKREAFW